MAQKQVSHFFHHKWWLLQTYSKIALNANIWEWEVLLIFQERFILKAVNQLQELLVHLLLLKILIYHQRNKFLHILSFLHFYEKYHLLEACQEKSFLYQDKIHYKLYDKQFRYNKYWFLQFIGMTIYLLENHRIKGPLNSYYLN